MIGQHDVGGDFSQVTDQEVTIVLDKAAASLAGSGPTL
jgi:hypothetical protein